jgi:glutathione S-transferase
MYELHIANKNYSSWSLRPWILMKALDIPFIERMNPFHEDSNWEAFRGFSPNGKVPCLHADGEVVWDSLAITEFLAERHASVWPQDRAARTWARCVAAEMHSGFSSLRSSCTMNCGVRIRLHEMPPALLSDIARIEELWAEGLTRFGGPFLAGPAFSAVDAFFAPVAFRVQTYGLELRPTAAAYAARLLALPAMKEWYDAGLRETWREPGHEAEAHAVGSWLQDLRATS